MVLTVTGSAFQRDEEKVIEKWYLAGPKSGHFIKGLWSYTVFEGYRPPGFRNIWAHICIIRNIKPCLVACNSNSRVWGRG